MGLGGAALLGSGAGRGACSPALALLRRAHPSCCWLLHQLLQNVVLGSLAVPAVYGIESNSTSSSESIQVIDFLPTGPPLMKGGRPKQEQHDADVVIAVVT